jgi:predicted  nucleic acid-binding Zn-ribbon protein
MKLKLAAILTLSILSFPVYAQLTPAQQTEFQKHYEALQNKYNVAYNKLRDLSEFQDFLKTQQEIAEFNKEVQAANQKAATPTPAVPAKK